MKLDPEEKECLDKLKNILIIPGFRSSYGPAHIMDHVFLGNKQDAHNVPLLKRLRITHVLNCAGMKDYSQDLRKQDNPYDPETTGVTNYRQFEARDNEGYPIMMHFDYSKSFIEDARVGGGRVLVHCEMGVNRSAAICVAYMMIKDNISLLEAVREIKRDRPVILCNSGFQLQLIQFAKERDLLHRKK